MKNLLDELDDTLRTNRSDLYSDLSTEVADEDIVALESLFYPLSIPQSVKLLYGWKNGCSEYLTPHFSFYSLDELSRNIRKYRRGEYCIGEMNDLDLPYCFIDLFTTAYVRFSMLVLSDDENKNPIINYDPQNYETLEFHIGFSNLKNCIKYINECTKHGAFDFEEFDYTEKEIEILRKIDPRVYPVIDDYGITKFRFDKPEDWPESMRDFKMPPFKVPVEAEEKQKKKSGLLGFFKR